MVDSWYCLDRFVPEGISQVSRRSEVGNTKRRSLNTRLSSGISAGTFAVSAGPYRNYHAKAGTKDEPCHVFGTISRKGLEIRSSRFEPKNSWLSFSRGSGPPLMIHKISYYKVRVAFFYNSFSPKNKSGNFFMFFEIFPGSPNAHPTRLGVSLVTQFAR